jgi:AraC-like DNA-binding protein
MMPANCGAALFRFSTDEMQQHERAVAVREMHERCTLPVKPEPMEPLSDQPTRVNISQWVLPGLGLMSGVLGGIRQQIRPEHSAPTGSDDAFLAFNSVGISVVTKRGGEVVVPAGQAFLAIRGATGFSVTRPTLVHFMGLRFPLTSLAPLVPDLDRSNVRVLPRGTAALRLLKRYLELIAQESALTTYELQRSAVAHIYDLAAITLGTQGDRAELARNRGVRAARLKAVKADIIAHLGDATLSIANVAGRQGVRLRYLQKLFEADGISFSEFVVAERLAKAYRILRNSLYAHRTISSIVYEVGFNDLSYFDRAFRRRYGLTPSDVREQLP